MESKFDKETKALKTRLDDIINYTAVLKANRHGEHFKIDIPEDFKHDFLKLVELVSLSLMEDKGNFYGYFLFQMAREIRFDISSPTAVNFKGAKYVIYFNPMIFLPLTIKQMETTIKHEIHHILSLHLVRAKELKGRYSTLAVNMAMDIVVNQHLDYLPPFATTIEKVNTKYGLELEPYESFEYYVEKLQIEIDLQEADDEGEIDDSDQDEEGEGETSYHPEKTHDLWDESEEIDEKTFREFTEKFISNAQKGTLSPEVESMIAALKNNKGELPWHLYLGRLMGMVESNKKKTTTRRNRRQPDRLDLRGTLRGHKAEIAVALDVSGSISDEEFKQAIKEVLNIVRNYNHEITIIECDHEIRRTYKVKSVKDIKERLHVRGATRFTPVFDYANKKKINLLVYFTDGKGEEKIEIVPRGYKILWVISGRGDQLSVKEPYGAVKKLTKVEVKDNMLDMSDVRSDGYSMNNQEPLY